MAANPLRIGIVGAGGFGTAVHIPGFQSEGFEVVAVSSRGEERAREAAAKFGIPHVFTDYRRLLEMQDLDAVSVVTPHSAHCEVAVAALEAGKHVLCEKPFAVDAAEAWTMLQAARRHPGQTAMLGHEFRWAPQRSYVKELLSQGYIGRLHFVHASLLIGRRGSAPPRVATGPDLGLRSGFLWSLGSHYLDAFRHWFGDIASVQAHMTSHYPERVDAQSGAVRRSEADDAFTVVVEFAQGGWGVLTASSAATLGQGANIDIFGSEGTISTPQPLPLAANPPPEGKVYGARVDGAERAELPMPERHRPFDDDRDHRLMAFRLMAREFARGIREGVSPAPNFEDGYRLQLVLDAAVESTQGGRKVLIPALEIG